MRHFIRNEWPVLLLVAATTVLILVVAIGSHRWNTMCREAGGIPLKSTTGMVCVDLKNQREIRL